VLSDAPVPSKALFDGARLFALSTLWLSGIVEGKPQKGDVEMLLVDGHWLVTLQLWNE
jgi:hypothetical protein